LYDWGQYDDTSSQFNVKFCALSITGIKKNQRSFLKILN